MQSIHEIRHKRHVPGLYRELRALLGTGGRLLVCDHVPVDDRGLHSTEAEQHVALGDAGFVDVTTILLVNGLYLCGGRRA